jgi:spore coat protein U-like protein
MKGTRFASCLLACTLALVAPAAYSAGCSVSTSGLSFGNYDVFSTLDSEITGSINVSCQSSTTYSVSLSSGFGTYASRSMTSGPNVLAYNLYIDPTHLTIWGDGSSGTATVSGSGTTGSSPVYGRIPARQNAVIGTYSDIVTVTVTF